MIITATALTGQIREIRVLDCTWIDGRPALLDGKGGFLSPDAEAVYLSFQKGDTLRNSLGEEYTPTRMP